MTNCELPVDRSQFTIEQKGPPPLCRGGLVVFVEGLTIRKKNTLSWFYLGGLILYWLIFVKRSRRLIWRIPAAFVRFHPVLVSA